jgi:hypothetical protein
MAAAPATAPVVQARKEVAPNMAQAETLESEPDLGAPRTAPGAGPLLLLALWILVAAALGFVDASFLEPYRVKIIQLSLMLFLVGLILAAVVARPFTLRASLLRLQLGPWIAVGFAVVFGLSSLTWLEEPTGTRLVVDQSLIVAGGGVALGGLVSMLVGYRLCPGILARAGDRIDRTIRGARTPPPTLAGALVLWALSMAAQGIDIASGSFGYLADPTQLATNSVPEVLALISGLGALATLLAAWLHATSRRASTRFVLAVVLGSQLLLGLFSATKEPFVVQFLAAFVGYGVRRRVRVVPVVTVAAIFVFFVTPFVTLYRTDVFTGSGRLTPAQVVANLSFGTLSRTALDSSRSNAFEEVATRLSRIGDVTVILQKTPGVVPSRSPLELVESPVLGVIPRSLWPGKPVLNAGYQMSSLYYELPTDVQTSNAPTPYGDLWRHGGIFELVVGMILLGFLVKIVDSRAGDPARDPRLLFLPMLLFFELVKQETDYVSFAASIVGFVLAAGLAARVVSVLSTNGSVPHRSTSA